jgi:copper transport protein
MRRALLLAGAVLLALSLTAAPARAHAGFVSSNPEPGAELGSAPGVVTLRFSEPLNERLSHAEVLSPDGRRFEGTPEESGDIVVRLTTNAQGIYRITWRTVSTVDGHTLEGSFEFGVGVRPSSTEGHTASSPGIVDSLIAIARAIEDAALLAAVGLLLARRLGRDLDWLRMPMMPVVATAFVGGLAVVLGEAFAAAASPSLSAIGAYLFSGLPGFARTMRVVLEALAVVVAIRRPAMVALPVVGALAALAAAGHAAAADPRWLGILVEVVHLLAVAAWTGGIIALAVQRPPGGWFRDQGALLLRRFTPVALVAFGVTAATGIVRAAQELGGIGALFGSGYGLVLAVKTLLVLIMAQLSVLAWRRLVVPPRAEASIAVGVIAAAALLAAFPLPPARVQESEAADIHEAEAAALPRAGDLTLGGHAGEVLVGLTVRPESDGSDRLLLYLQDLGSEATTASRPVDLRIDGRTVDVTLCGPTCREAPATLRGGDRIEVGIGGEHGGVARFRLPELSARPADGIVAEMMGRMHALRSYRLEEDLSSGLGTTLRSRYEFLAPDSYRTEVVERGDVVSQTVVIDTTRYLRDPPGRSWEKQTGGPGLSVPSFIWDYFEPFVGPRVIGRVRVNGVSTTVVSFFGGAEQGTPVWFRLWIHDDGLVRQAEMRAQGHFMDHRYYGFDAPITIRPPEGLSG